MAGGWETKLTCPKCGSNRVNLTQGDIHSAVMVRDCLERGRTAEEVIERYQRVLKPMHQLHIEPCKKFADIIVPEGGHNEVAINLLTDYIKSRLEKKRNKS